MVENTKTLLFDLKKVVAPYHKLLVRWYEDKFKNSNLNI